ncbi:neurotensin receptor type 1-like isoform X2 [Gouania willdenowi]|uniref:neurotensin receptor type 1-like isoform X2 n=1 Tax=Gouania willdenowi TaxID=441366 RepID=UPI001056DAE1|nr:neurotensin receptor type 1-like isoform X2 [Gouania willdenowi]
MKRTRRSSELMIHDQRKHSTNESKTTESTHTHTRTHTHTLTLACRMEVNATLVLSAVTVIYAVLFVVGCVGNSITVYALLTRRSLQNLQSTVHYHLTSLAVSDLLILVLSMPIELYNFIWFHHPWRFGDAVCRGYYFLRDSCSYATALNIASLSVERYMAIIHPFKTKSIMSRSRTKKLISLMWITSFILSTPMVFIMGQETRQGENICTVVVSDLTMKTVLQVSVCVCVCVCVCAPRERFARSPSLLLRTEWEREQCVTAPSTLRTRTSDSARAQQNN